MIQKVRASVTEERRRERREREERERRRKMEVDESAMAPREVVNPTGTIHYASSESPRGSWFSFSLAAGLAFLETYGWFLLAGLVATSFLMPSLQR